MITLTKELLRARAATAPPPPPAIPTKPDYDGFDDGDGADLDDGYEDYAASRAVVDDELAQAAGAEPPPQPEGMAKETATLPAGPAKVESSAPATGATGFSFADGFRKLEARQDSVPRLLAGAREQLVAHLVRRPAVLRMARPHLRPEHFHLPDEKVHQILVRQLFALHDAAEIPPGGPSFAALHGPLATLVESDYAGVKTGSLSGQRQAEMQKLADELYGDAGAPGGPGMLRRIFDLPAEDLDDPQGAALLRQFLAERQLFDPLAELTLNSHGRVPKDLAATLDEFRARARTFAALGVPRRSFREELDALLDAVSEGWGRELLGLKTGMGRLDKLLGGLQGLTVLGAPPGTGKTALVTQLGVGVAEHRDANDAVAIFLVLDMATDVVQARVVSYMAGLDFEVITKGSRELRLDPTGPYMTEADSAKLEAGVDRLGADGTADRLFFLGREAVGAGVSAASLRALIDACKARAGAERALLIVDYLQLLPASPPPSPTPWPGARPGPARFEDPMEAARRLIDMIRDAIRPPEGTPSWARDAALVVSETRKGNPNAKGDSVQTLDDLTGYARLGYAPDAVLLLRAMTDPDVERVYRVKKESVKLMRATLKTRRTAPLMLKIDKARDGMYKGDIPLEFAYTRSTMTPVADPFEDDPTAAPWHPANPAPPPSASPQTQPGASPGDAVGDGHVGPASAPAGPGAPPPPQGPPGQAVVPSGAPTTVTVAEKILEALAGFPAGETTSVIAKAAKLSNAKTKEALAQLGAEGLVIQVTLTKVAGKMLRTFDGFAPASTGAHQGPAATKPG